MFSDYIGLHVGGWLSVSKNFELGAGLAGDLKHASDAYHAYLVELRARLFL